jgi:hypothetical protein
MRPRDGLLANDSRVERLIVALVLLLDVTPSVILHSLDVTSSKQFRLTSDRASSRFISGALLDPSEQPPANIAFSRFE